jgi:hypothetical protein
MDGTGDHHVKQSKPSSKRQRPHVFSHIWKLDPKIYIYIFTNTKMIIYTYICICCICVERIHNEMH